MLVMQHEVIRYVESVMRAIDFSDEALGFTEVAAAGPGGNYIDSDFTADHFRQELWFPRLLDRAYYDSWLEGGAQDMRARCAEQKAELLATHTPEPLDDELAKTLDEIVAAAKRE